MQKWEIEQKILEKSSSHADSPQQTSLSNADIFSERTVLDMQKWKEKVFIPTDKRPRVHKNQIANHVISSTIGKSAFNESIIPITRYIFFRLLETSYELTKLIMVRILSVLWLFQFCDIVPSHLFLWILPKIMFYRGNFLVTNIKNYFAAFIQWKP